jgi:hypothetical protein
LLLTGLAVGGDVARLPLVDLHAVDEQRAHARRDFLVE